MNQNLPRVVVLATAFLSSCAAPAPWAGGRWVDLTQDFSKDTFAWPAATRVRLEKVAENGSAAAYFCFANRFGAVEYAGTRSDTRIRFELCGAAVDDIPIPRLIGPAMVVDVTEACSSNHDYKVAVADFERWEAAHGPMPAGAIVLLRTGQSLDWPAIIRSWGTVERATESMSLFGFPGLQPDAATWLAHREVGAVGLDTQIEYGHWSGSQGHVILFAHGIPVLENVAHLDRLPTRGAVVCALPMKNRHETGAPLRIVAWLEP